MAKLCRDHKELYPTPMMVGKGCSIGVLSINQGRFSQPWMPEAFLGLVRPKRWTSHAHHLSDCATASLCLAVSGGLCPFRRPRN